MVNHVTEDFCLRTAIESRHVNQNVNFISAWVFVIIKVLPRPYAAELDTASIFQNFPNCEQMRM